MTPIIVAMRAPVLSATSSLDRSCTIGPTIYSRVISELRLKHFQQTPALELAQRTRFHDAHHVARFCLLLLIVRVKLFHLLDDLAELRMRHARDRPHHDRLVHATRNHFAGARLARSAGQRRWQWRRLGNYWLFLLGHRYLFMRCRFTSFRKHRLNARDVAPHQPQSARLFGLAA